MSYISSPKVKTLCMVHTDCYSMGTGLCLQLNGRGVGVQLPGTGMGLTWNRLGKVCS